MSLGGAFVSELPILDAEPLRDLLELGAEEGLVQELIGLYQEDVPPRMVALREGLAAGDLPRMLMEAHQMKGALSNLGLVRFAHMAARVEAEARAGHLVESPALIAALPAAFDEGLAAFREAFPER
ncbi:Hpt domain-containing protein [Geothrix sp. PMB-07]|uniref:Hpt domain-containing protein n=1 Tax=Geothrix sp. PMB-07 TaxID=3068640 RepID=UPI0027422B00|nr:Hpt domain-containing protein [Geothrix sp. PMB-07]WLT31164.1 Hpt domain-containing protein [Geothrix sp. PMB-07]